MPTKLEDSFSSTTNIIMGVIEDAANEKFDEIKKEKETKLINHSLIAERKKLEAEEEKLKEKMEINSDKQQENSRVIKIAEAETPYNKLDAVTQKVMGELHGLQEHRYSNNSANVVDIATSKEMIDTKEFQNFLTVKGLVRDVINIFGLACGVKEQRAVILKLQAVDWQSLGIDLPYLDFMNVDFKISVADGKVKTTARILLTGPLTGPKN